MGRVSFLFVLLAGVSLASTVVTPDSFGGPYCEADFGKPTCSIGKEYEVGGVHLGLLAGLGTLHDGNSYYWASIGHHGLYDAFDSHLPVAGRLLKPADFLTVEIGFNAPGTVMLSVGDGVYSLNGDSKIGPHAGQLITIEARGIRDFLIRPVDPFGTANLILYQIEFGRDSGAHNPEPSTLVMLAVAGLAVGLGAKRR